MHSHDPKKDIDAFWNEIRAILAGTSPHDQGRDVHDFQGFVFPRPITFQNLTFTQLANFRGITFIGDANFSGATFAQKADFMAATFSKDADFSRARFTQYANFCDATFTQYANFHGVTFTQGANFGDANFTQHANFRSATFTQDADFRGVNFTENASFAIATFTQNATFNGATFTQNAEFSFATFTQDANFHRVTFTQDADFSAAMVAQDAYFDNATFTGIANFGGATFTQNVRFLEANFGGTADFSHLTLPKDAEVLFHRVNEKAGGLKARFLNCLLDRFRFEDVNWYFEDGRLMVQDEMDLRAGEEGGTHELVAHAYRRLVNNFERDRQYELAEQCVVGEMEMRRQNPRNFLFGRKERASDFHRKHRWASWLGEHFSALYLYRVLSLYGASYRRALGWLFIFFLLLFPALFGLSGIRPAGSPSGRPTLRTVVSPREPVTSWSTAKRDAAVTHDPVAEWLYVYRSALLLSLEVATFQREKSFEPVEWNGKVLTALEAIVIPGQLALLLLALRRRFRR